MKNLCTVMILCAVSACGSTSDDRPAGASTGSALAMLASPETSRKLRCSASGASFKGGYPGTADAVARLELTEVRQGAAVSEIRNIRGTVVIDPATVEFGEPTFGSFSIPSLRANPDYKPRKYKGYTQFREFDAQEDDFNSLQGEFLLKDAPEDREFHAVYQFKGEPASGVLHLTCEVYR